VEELKIAFPARNPDFGIIIPNQEKLDNQNEIEMRLKTLPKGRVGVTAPAGIKNPPQGGVCTLVALLGPLPVTV
jgi:hypothetical protein